MILCISVLCVVISQFSFLILLMWHFSLFFVMSLSNGLSFYLLKEPTFSFVDFGYGLLCFLCIYFCPNFFMISLLLLTLPCFISSFSSCFQCRDSYLFDFAPVSWGMLVLLWMFPLALLLLNPIGFEWLCFHFHSFLCIFRSLFKFLLWFIGLSEVCCLASICLYF